MISTEFLITSFIVVLLPGSGAIYTISIGLFHNSRTSAFAALGCTIVGIIPSILACILGQADVLHTSALLFHLIKFVGVVYLHNLALGMWQDSGRLVLDDKVETTIMFATAIKEFFLGISST